MPRDVQIVRSASEAAPKDYTIPKDAEVILRAVKATFTDNGAGTDWLPCVTLLSDSGHKIAQALDTNVKVTAGDDAEVSWFPGVKPGGASSGTTALKWCKVVCNGSAPPTDPLAIVSFDTNDAANYVQVDASHWQIPSVPQVLVGYSNPSAAVTTNGSIVAGARAGSGYTTYGSAGAGVAVQILPFVDLLHTNFDLQNDWDAYATGTDTHLWSVHASYFYVG